MLACHRRGTISNIDTEIDPDGFDDAAKRKLAFSSLQENELT